MEISINKLKSMIPISEILISADPLSDENCESLILHAEEDTLVDYKEAFNPSEEKAWLGITKDILAFSNTEGGFLIFGVRDSSFAPIGIEPEGAKILGDANNILQKINRFIEPDLTNLRSKQITFSNKIFAIVFVPSAVNITRTIKNDGKFKYPSGEEKYEFRKGNIYVRRSAGNHLVDSRDLDEIFNKKLANYRDSILNKIARVVEAPTESEVFLVSRDLDSKDATKFIIDDSPEAIPVKGMSFTIEPKTEEHEIASSIALNKRNPLSIPPNHTLWEWYKKREELILTKEQKCTLAKFCIINEVPCFFWLKESNSEEIAQMLIDTIRYQGSTNYYGRVLLVANFLGKSVFNLVLSKLGKHIERISSRKRRFLKDDIFSLVNMGRLNSRNMKLSTEKEIDYRKRILEELSTIVETIITSNPRMPNFVKCDEAIAYDCYLYAKLNKYRSE